jgi:hypothetical protein
MKKINILCVSYFSLWTRMSTMWVPTGPQQRNCVENKCLTFAKEQKFSKLKMSLWFGGSAFPQVTERAVKRWRLHMYLRSWVLQTFVFSENRRTASVESTTGPRLLFFHLFLLRKVQLWNEIGRRPENRKFCWGGNPKVGWFKRISRFPGILAHWVLWN